MRAYRAQHGPDAMMAAGKTKLPNLRRSIKENEEHSAAEDSGLSMNDRIANQRPAEPEPRVYDIISVYINMYERCN